MPIPLETERLYPHQLAWLSSDAFWSAMVGPYGCGKTGAGVLWAMEKTVQNTGCRGLWIEPTFGMIKDILLPELEQYLSSLGMVETVNAKRALRVEEYSILRSGRPELMLAIGTWMLRSGEVPSRLKGPTVAWALLDEADLMDREVEDIAISRVRDPQASVLAIGHVGTPENYGSWLHDRVEGDSRQAGDCIVRARQEDVTGLPKTYYARMKESYDEATFDQYAHGRWVLKTEGLIFSPPFSEDNIRPCPHRRGWPVLIGMDFNVDPFCFLACHEVEGCLEVFRQYRIKGCNSQSAAEILKRDYPDVPIETWADSAGNQRRTSGLSGTDVEILRQAGLEVHWKTIQRANNKYNSLRAMIRNAAGDRRLFIDPSCSQLIRELRTLTYEEAAKAGADDHSTDALAYLVFGRYNPIQRDRWGISC